MQDDQLFAGSLAENISFFDAAHDAQRAETAARIAAVHEDIIAMPMGYESLVGDMGSALSGGQKQRILLARALYRQPRLLFLDEATSHLDVRAERLVSTAIAELRLTRLIVAHRPETIASCDPRAVAATGRCRARTAQRRQKPAGRWLDGRCARAGRRRRHELLRPQHCADQHEHRGKRQQYRREGAAGEREQQPGFDELQQAEDHDDFARHRMRLEGHQQVKQ